MQGLSHGVIRVDSEEKLSVLTLQDVGSVMPGGETDLTPNMTTLSQKEITPQVLYQTDDSGAWFEYLLLFSGRCTFH